jgi:hypothetical protein
LQAPLLRHIVQEAVKICSHNDSADFMMKVAAGALLFTLLAAAGGAQGKDMKTGFCEYRIKIEIT